MIPRGFRLAPQCRQEKTETLDHETETHQRKTGALPGQQRALRSKQNAWIAWTGSVKADESGMNDSTVVMRLSPR